MRKYGVDFKLDKLVDSEDYKDREKAAKQGYGLDKLVYDEYWAVRKAVAKQEYGLDILINDIDYEVREAVAEHGYRLNKLIDDKNRDVRKIIAKQGYGLDILINDKNSFVRDAVDEYLREHNYKSVFEWAKDNNINIDLDKWLKSNNWCKRRQVAKQGYKLDKLVYDENWSVRDAVDDYLEEHNYKSVFEWAKDNNVDINLDEWLNSNNWIKRYTVALQGYGLDKLVNDENAGVRVAVARQGYRLDKLVNDKDKAVFEAVYDYVREHKYKSVFEWAKNNNINIDLDEWLNSDNWHKRYEVVKQGYRLDKLVYDEDIDVSIAANDYLTDHNYKSVLDWAENNDISIDIDDWLNSDNCAKRYAVAKQGYRLDKLVNDADEDVRIAVEDYLKEHSYKSVFDWAKDNNVDIDINEWLHSDDRYKREQVAKQGYGLDKLAYDKSRSVRAAVSNYLNEHDLTLKEWCE